MTRDDIIRMAQEAGFEHIAEADYWHPLFERFAALVASAEREYMQDKIDRLYMLYEQACQQRDQLMEVNKAQVALMHRRMQ
jgi:hypothetical protein